MQLSKRVSSSSCPAGGECLTSAVVYKATGAVITYTDSTERKFKDRQYEHSTDDNTSSHRKHINWPDIPGPKKTQKCWSE